jgi:proline iminopeptidase
VPRERLIASSEGYVTTEDGMRLFFTTLGTGPGTLLIPNGPPLIDDFLSLAVNRMLIFYDPRNRGLSDAAQDHSRASGIHHDVDDMEAVRRHFGLARIDLLGHSYLGLAVILFAMKYPTRVRRIVQIGAVAPIPATQYPPELSWTDDILTATLSELTELWKRPSTDDPELACRRLWSVLRRIYVVNPADVDKLDRWQRCHLPNERHAAEYAMETIIPSYISLALSASDVATVTMPVLTIHGRKDRSAPFGGGQDWANLLPNGRLLTIENAGHMPWIDAPSVVLPSIERFLTEEPDQRR